MRYLVHSKLDTHLCYSDSYRQSSESLHSARHPDKPGIKVRKADLCPSHFSNLPERKMEVGVRKPKLKLERSWICVPYCKDVAELR